MWVPKTVPFIILLHWQWTNQLSFQEVLWRLLNAGLNFQECCLSSLSLKIFINKKGIHWRLRSWPDSRWKISSIKSHLVGWVTGDTLQPSTTLCYAFEISRADILKVQPLNSTFDVFFNVFFRSVYRHTCCSTFLSLEPFFSFHT